ncbi:MAG: hypothetical protein ACRDF4_03050 [Rhabdochlamydiaceae bacterium]
MAQFIEFEAITGEAILVNEDHIAMLTVNPEDDELSMLHLSLPAEQTFVRIAVRGTYKMLRERLMAKQKNS